MTQKLKDIDVDVLLAKSEPAPLFVVIRPQCVITPEQAEEIRRQWDLFIAANPTAKIPPCVLLPKQLDVEAVYEPQLPPEAAVNA